MLMWLLISVGVAFASALLPIISVEIFLIGLVTHRPGIPWVALGAAIAVGQIAGKLIYYFAARGSLPLPKFMHRKPKVKPPSDRREAWGSRDERPRAVGVRVPARGHPPS